jgi:integrase/recombinase XerD
MAICQINSVVVDNFILFLRNEMDDNDTTMNTNIRGIRTVLYYFMKLGYLNEFKISKVQEVKEIIETYSDAEINILLRKPNLNKSTYLEYRNWVIINFLLASGCRARTLVNIKVQDLDFENQLISYKFTKNRKQQIVPMSNSLKKVLVEYLEYRKPEAMDDYIFVNAYGQQIKTDLLSQNLREHNRKHGVMKTGVHRWRHTFSKMWILKGGDIFRLQKILGHSDLEIIKNYVNMFTNDLQKDFDKFNPLEQLANNKSFLRLQ